MTRTVKLHENVCCFASVIEHATVVVPTGNAEPEAGEHVTDIGATAPAAVASAKVTATGCPDVEPVTIGAGHVAAWFGEGSVPLGSVDDLELVQPAATAEKDATAHAAATRRHTLRIAEADRVPT